MEDRIGAWGETPEQCIEYWGARKNTSDAIGEPRGDGEE